MLLSVKFDSGILTKTNHSSSSVLIKLKSFIKESTLGHVGSPKGILFWGPVYSIISVVSGSGVDGVKAITSGLMINKQKQIIPQRINRKMSK